MRALKTLAILGAVAAATPAMATDFSYTNFVAIPGGILSIGPASEFPIEFVVSGMAPRITDVNLTLLDLHHSFADDVAIALESPTGTAVLLLTDAGGPSNFAGNYTFDQAAAALPNSFGGNNAVIPGGSYGPSTYGINPIAGLLTDGNSLDLFNGENPNGTWKLWIIDDHLIDRGYMSGATLSLAAVPEPATWAMMIGGLGLVGLQMRRRRTNVSFA